jgi:1-acyl-sn-glycerol-3-phosphate acyltransferase
MLALRSVLFAVLFYGLFSVSAPFAAFLSIVMPRRLPGFARAWSQAWLALYAKICGATYEVRGREHLPPGGCVLAMKHQSVWDTCALFAIFERPVYVFKSELRWIPFFGWALLRLGCVPVKRGRGKLALDDMVAGTRVALDEHKQVVIFPEGTRTMVGQAPKYKTGISYLYEQLGVACVPVALNSGLIWPRRSFLRPAGRIVVEILPAIEPGMPRKEMLDHLVEVIESASNRLAQEGALTHGTTPIGA